MTSLLATEKISLSGFNAGERRCFYHILHCQYCGIEQKRALNVKKATCWECREALRTINGVLSKILKARVLSNKSISQRSRSQKRQP